ETNVRSALNYVPQPGDVFIVGYPKCGNTWIEHIVYNIFNDRAPPKSFIDYLEEMPFLEWQGAEAARGMRRPGSIKTHMPFHLQPYSKDAKYICISRNPYDCCVSFYYHTRGKHIFIFSDGTFDEFFEMFLAGKVACGDYFVHLMSWYEHRNDPNVLFLTYEDLKVDTATWVMKIADFLGDDYGKKLRADERALENILSKTNFEAMKEHMNEAHKNLFCEMSSMPENKKPDWNHKSFDFLRKGAVGDWTTHFSDEQVKRLKEHIELKTRGSDVMSLWKTIQLPLTKGLQNVPLTRNCRNEVRSLRFTKTRGAGVRRSTAFGFLTTSRSASKTTPRATFRTTSSTTTRTTSRMAARTTSRMTSYSYYVHWGFPETNVRSALNYVPQPGDVFIVGYPKCGNTWLEHIVYNIFNNRAPPKSFIDYLEEMPFLEWQGAEAARGMRRPGSIKTHMPFHLQPYSKDAKYICISRNPYDCCVSFYYHTRGKHIFRFSDGTFDEFFEMFLAGKVSCGDYFVHLMSWYEHRDDPNVLFLTYEDLKVDTATWVMKIADFLGDDYGKKLRADERALENILSKTNFEAMKEHMNAAHKNLSCEMRSMPEGKKPEWVKLSRNAVGDWVPKKNHKSFDFLRKGAVGDWTTHFSDEQVKRLKEHIELKTRGSNV
ncbi:unnamed protein product, partial [Ixodes pacificus]